MENRVTDAVVLEVVHEVSSIALCKGEGRGERGEEGRGVVRGRQGDRG